MKKEKMKSQILPSIVFVLMAVVVLYPFLMLVAVSFSNEQEIIVNGYKLIPTKIDFAAYKFIFKTKESVINAYAVTATFSVLSMVLSTVLTALAAYPLSLPLMKGRKIISFYFYFTMLFSGGLVPSYILITQYLKLDDTIWVYILPTLMSPWNMFMMRSFFQGIPPALRESMKIDGASEYTILVRLIIPLSKPVIATVALMVFLTKWNDWNTAMLYINDPSLISLQYLLQKMLRDVQFLQDNLESSITIRASDVPTTTVQMAMAIVVAGPALFVFPFFQKYFVKGMTIGSVKG